MPLHETKDVKDELNESVYSSADLSVSMPKYRMPENEHSPRHAYQVVHDELMLDGNSRQNLATFCQTWVEPEVHKLMDECIDKNMIDKDEYPQTAEIEARCVNMLADLWNSPESANGTGCSTTGSSEAAMLGGMAMKWRWREKMRAAGKPTDKPNMITGPNWSSILVPMITSSPSGAMGLTRTPRRSADGLKRLAFMTISW